MRLLALLLAIWATAAAADQQSVTLSKAGPSIPLRLNLDSRRFNFGVGIICTISAGGSMTYQVEVSGDDPVILGGPLAFQHWNLHDTLNGLTTSMNGNLAFPVIALRINVVSYTSGSVTCSIVQTNPF